MIAVLAALLSGAMFYLSMGLNDAWALAWFAPVPLLWLAYGKAPLWQVLAASAVALLASGTYIFQCYDMAMALPIIPALAILALLFALAVWFARAVQQHTNPVVTLLAFPACWTAIEFLSERVSPSGTNGSFAYSQVSTPLLIQSASLFGMYAVTFLICLFANTVAMALRAQRQTAAAIGLGMLICAANVVFGYVRMAQPQLDTLRVAAAVDETATAKSWKAQTLPEAVAISNAYARAVRSAAAQGATFVVTPEGGILSIPRWNSAIFAPLVAASRDTGAQIVAGFYQRTPPADFALTIMPDGTMRRYDKRHPVPGLEARFTPGRTSGLISDGGAVEICMDMDFPDTIRSDAIKNVRFMGVPAGDFDKDAWLHARNAVMRGVENGFSLVRPAHAGLLLISDANGRLIAVKKAAPADLTLAVADLPAGHGATLYTRIGNLFAWLCVALSIVIEAYMLLLRRKNLRSSAETSYA